MRPAWKYYSQRRGVTIDALLQTGISTYAELVSYCDRVGVQAPEKDLFEVALERSKPPEPTPPVVKKQEPPAVEKKPTRRKPAPKKGRRKKAGT